MAFSIVIQVYNGEVPEWLNGLAWKVSVRC